MQNLREVGKSWEKRAKRFLIKKGYKIRTTNFNTPFGEIDIIAEIKDTIVFIEVKFRTSSRYGEPEEAITPYKKMHMVRAALFYLKRYGKNKYFRFDVITMTPSYINHYENAFEAEEGFIF